MKLFFRTILCVCIALLFFISCGCSNKGEEMEAPELPSTSQILVDLRDEEDYDAIFHYIESHPDEIILYDVTLGGKDYEPEVTELTFPPEETPYDDLLRNLKYLPNITTLNLPDTSLTGHQMRNLQEAYPNLQIRYTVSFNGQTIDLNTTEMNISHLSADQIPFIAAKLSLLPQLQQVQLMRADGTSSLSQTDVKMLQQACPEVIFLYTPN